MPNYYLFKYIIKDIEKHKKNVDDDDDDDLNNEHFCNFLAILLNQLKNDENLETSTEIFRLLTTISTNPECKAFLIGYVF